MRTECLISGDVEAIVKVRCASYSCRPDRGVLPGYATGSLPEGWQEAVERDVALPEYAIESSVREPVSYAFRFHLTRRSVQRLTRLRT